MIPAVTAVRMSGAQHRADLPLLVLGPALGTSASALWTEAARGLTDVFDVLAWDLPGHGHNRSLPEEPFDVAELAAGVLSVVDEVLLQRDEVGGAFSYAGTSVGGAVGLQLLLDAPGRVRDAVLLATGATLGQRAMWEGRMTQVAMSGTQVLVAGSPDRWFAPGFAERRPDVVAPLVKALADTVDDAYRHVCAAVAGFDVRARLGEIAVPVLAVAGAADHATPAALLEAVAGGVREGRLVVLDDVAHLAPAEAPEQVARLIRQHALGEAPPASSAPGERYEAGAALRREVMGDAHVDRAEAATTDLTRDLEALATEYEWGAVWSRPGLDRRSRSLVTLTALVARGHHEELAEHVRAALGNGVTVEELHELLLQTAVYCGLPDAARASRVVQRVLDEDGPAC
ncbi:alpha/beta fold hydrolase [Nocardioides lijunqiniae]|uniref:bifunctional 3-oxoadipate enol-lactonase/4-carboxymuconolactone decarboxylase PcaDC n=1 Tax=Nocardioides lijunqiniae TaxID=2760832 RepID=UPI0018776017|nr:alpha/beta fold hydrolase [Nocardioides lijunqiniae]